MRINTNISAMTANNSLQKAQENLSNSIKRLSSGYKINSSEDDPAGCAISEKMRLQIRGLNQADNNAADGESVLNTAEGALQEVNAMLSRMKELTVQAANDVNSDSEREAIQQEIDSINDEIDRITTETEFNTQSLLNGNLSRRVYSNVQGVNTLEVSDNYTAGNYGITITQDARQAVLKGTSTISADNTTVGVSGSVSINGYTVSISATDTYSDVVQKIQEGADKAGCKAFLASGTVDTTDQLPTGATNTTGGDVATGNGNGTEYAGYSTSSNGTLTFMTKGYGSDESITISCSSTALATALGITGTDVSGGVTVQGLDAKAEFTTDASDNRVGFSDSAAITTSGTVVTVTDVNGRVMKIDVPGNAAGTSFTDQKTNATSSTGSTAAAGGSSKAIVQEVTDLGTMSIHIGANEDQTIKLDIPNVSTYTLGTDTINVMTSISSQKAINKVDEAVNYVNSVRSKIGAYSNRFEHTRNNLAVSTENSESSLSTMMDTDMAEEMTTYTSLNVLTQAATSILSQANERPSTVLQILQ